MNLQCVNCGEPIPAKNINIQKTLALCDNCGTVFDFSETAISKPATEKAKPRKVKQPSDMHVDENPGQLHFRFRWSFKVIPATVNVLMMLWLLAGLGFPVFAALMSGEPKALGFGLLLGAFPLYYLISLFTNAIHVELNESTLSSGSKPLPWFDGKNVPIDQIDRLTYKQSDVFETFYDLCAELYDGRTIKLIDVIPYEHAVFIAHETNAYLHSLNDTDADDFEHLTDTVDLPNELNLDHPEQVAKHE